MENVNHVVNAKHGMIRGIIPYLSGRESDGVFLNTDQGKIFRILLNTT